MIKDIVRPFYGSERFSKSCRPNGQCPWCRGNRKYQELKEIEKAKASEREASDIVTNKGAYLSGCLS